LQSSHGMMQFLTIGDTEPMRWAIFLFLFSFNWQARRYEGSTYLSCYNIHLQRFFFCMDICVPK